MNDEEINEILKDPKKILDLFRIFHRMIHLYEAQEMINQKLNRDKTNEKMGLSDSIDIQILRSNKSQEVKQ